MKSPIPVLIPAAKPSGVAAELQPGAASGAGAMVARPFFGGTGTYEKPGSCWISLFLRCMSG